MPLRLAMHRVVRPIRLLLPLLAVFAMAHAALAGDLAADLAEIARKSGIAPQRLAFVVHDVRGDRVLAVQNGDAPMAPASNMKVLTTGAALSVLGPDFTFNTTLWLDRQNGTARLTLVGSGDPALDDPDLRDRDPHGFDALVGLWSEELKKAGVTRVDELVVDARVFDREFYHPSWPREQYPNAYCAEVWGLNLARNVVGITPVPQSSGKPTVVFTPAFDIAVERNNATNNAKAKFTFSASRSFGSNSLTLRGNAQKRPDTPLGLTVHDTPSLTAVLLQRAFAARGIEVTRARLATDTDPRATGTIVPPIHATPIATVLERANTDSENLYAEALIKRLGAALAVAEAKDAKFAPPAGFTAGTWTNGRAALRQSIAAVLGSDTLSGWTIDDGSGLSQENRVTASGLARWHAAFARDNRLAPIYFGSFAIAGKTGTVRKRFDDLESSPVEVRCKTGYIRGVSTLSGLAIAPDGRLLSFSILGNNLAQGDQISRARALQESMVRRIVQELAPAPAPRTADAREASRR
ncbi:MAG: putative D-alanyl-D-alanine carboxypeptidase [Planctomycetota bacterium]|jgi:D-alanyl-D-alanine carboxypeptidase/D-alanyl-D-alanine-endopeptidase (penicillin-binding protein 4)